MEYVIEKCSACRDGYIVAVTTIDESGNEIVDYASCDNCFNIIMISQEPIENFGFAKTPSHSGEVMLEIQEELAQKYRYKPLKPDLSSRYRNLYYVELPEICKQNMNQFQMVLQTTKGTHFADGWTRIVIGDYGAFIEIAPDQIHKEKLIVAPGQEYRINDSKYNEHCKYQWLTVPDGSQIKIYYQIKAVTYADYQPNMYYVSPYEIKF